MRSLITACLTAGWLLVASSTVLATPVVIWDQTVNVNTLSSPGGAITWQQPFSIAPAYSTYTITGATLTIVANDVDPGSPTCFGKLLLGELDDVYKGPASSGPWGTSLGTLTQGPDGTDTTTVFNLADYATLAGPFYVKVQVDPMPGWDFTATVKTSQLVVWAEEPPVVPVPGAVLLASLGAGLVSWLRARKAL